MNLTLHQFRKDVYQFRHVLCGIGVLLLLDLAVTQGWIGQPAWEWPYHVSAISIAWRTWTSAMAIGAAFIVTIGPVLGDSTARENSFLRTRPMPARDLWLGKGLFLGVTIIVPFVLIEFVNLLLHGLDLTLVLAGTWERFTLVLPLVIIAAAVAAACPHQKTFAIFIAVAYVVGVAGAGLTVLLFHTLPATLGRESFALQEPDATSLRIGFAVWAVLMTGLAWWVVTRRPRALYRWTVVVVFILAGLMAIVFGPHNRPLQGLAQSDAIARMQKLPVRLPIGSINLIRSQSTIPEIVHLGWSLRPEFEGLPAGWLVRWGPCSAQLTTADGKTQVGRPYGHRPNVFDRYFNLTTDDERCISQLLPDGAIVDSRDHHNAGSSMSYRPFDLPATGDWWNQPAKLEVAGPASVYQWEIAAELDLTPGSTARSGPALWRIGASRIDPAGTVYVGLENETVGLSMTTDQNRYKSDRWPTDRYEFLLYDPVRKLARTLDQRYISGSSVGSHTAVQRQRASLTFRENDLRQDGWRENPGKLRLLVFRLNYLGALERTVQTTFVPSRFRGYYSSQNRIDDDRLTAEEFLRRLEKIEKPPVTASRSRVGNYVHEVLTLVEAARRYSQSGHEIQILAEYVPNHLDLFIDGFGVADGMSRNALMGAIRLGLRPGQREHLLKRLSDEPELVDILIQRDWLDSSRPQMFALLDHCESLPYTALRGLAWFEEPRMDERLIQEFEARLGENGLYDLLADLPRMGTRIDRVVQDAWRTRTKYVDNQGSRRGIVQTAMRHGITEAVDYAFRLLRLRNDGQGNYDHDLLQSLGKLVDIPGLDLRYRYDSTRVRKALMDLGDVTFEWDAARRKYRVAKIQDPNGKAR